MYAEKQIGGGTGFRIGMQVGTMLLLALLLLLIRPVKAEATTIDGRRYAGVENGLYCVFWNVTDWTPNTWIRFAMYVDNTDPTWIEIEPDGSSAVVVQGSLQNFSKKAHPFRGGSVKRQTTPRRTRGSEEAEAGRYTLYGSAIRIPCGSTRTVPIMLQALSRRQDLPTVRQRR